MNIPPLPTRIVTSDKSWQLIVDILNSVREQAYKDGFADGYNKGLQDK
jgi:hypothetical protein